MIHRPKLIDIVETGDGSKTLHDRHRDLHYRSTHGARQESDHVFVRGTRLHEREPPWTILELGFGAAVNFTGTVAALPDGAALNYHAVEHAPVYAENVDFHPGPAGDVAREALKQAERSGQTVHCSADDGRIELSLHLVDWSTFRHPELRADAVYFDPFGPRSDPNSWTVECFEVARDHMSPEAILGTYSAASDVKRAMFHAGFNVASAPGPGRKREVTFASLSQEALAPYDLLSRERYVEGNE
jgi:tRNA U34 5-methylaminomethyl-2-thiouridine-forming methyltransferase MnmC